MRTIVIVCLAFCAGMESTTNGVSSEFAKSSAEITVPSPDGEMHGTKFPVLIDGSQDRRPGLANIVYLPKTGFAWTGGALYETQVAAFEDRILGFCYHGGGVNKLIASASTNRYEPGLRDTTTMVQTELAKFKAGPWSHAGDPQYFMRVEKILGPLVMRDRFKPEEWPDTNAFSLVIRPSRLRAIAVEGTNAVVSLEIGTNILARIAFTKEVVPVWVTTNGVSIGPIPTNCVFYSEVISNKVVTKVVY